MVATQEEEEDFEEFQSGKLPQSVLRCLHPLPLLVLLSLLLSLLGLLVPLFLLAIALVVVFLTAVITLILILGKTLI